MITKPLKYGAFTFDEDTREFHIEFQNMKHGGLVKSIELNKVYAVAFARFVIRMLVAGFYRKVK